MKFTSYFSNLSIKSNYSNFLKLKNHSYSPSYLRQLERSLKWLGVVSRACDGAEETETCAKSFRRGGMSLKCLTTSS